MEPFAEWLREVEGTRSVTAEQAHEVLTVAVLGAQQVTIPTTGEVIDVPPSTRNMKTDEFADYVDRAARWLGEFCGIVVVSPEMFGRDA